MIASSFRRLKRLACIGMAASLSAIAASAGGYTLVWDDFKDGFSVNAPGAKWFYFAAGPFVGNDGLETTSNQGLRVVSPGVNPITGLPAFTSTLGQEGSPDNPFSLPGGIDHVKWLVYANNTATSGYPGFDCIPGQELQFDAWVSGRSYGNEFHPFGIAVADPDDDIRLANPAVPTIDFENFLVADFFLTNKRIYALYERLPFNRTATNNYAAFTYAIPVAERLPHQQHKLTIGYDKSRNLIRWYVGGKEVFRVTRPGYRLASNEHLVIDHGGVEEDVVSRQRNIGFGTFTLLDAASPTQQALVRLSTAPDFYFNTLTGQPTPQTFLDELSLPGSRLWGQGAELNVRKVVVSSR